jgi:hypothetical protein
LVVYVTAYHKNIGSTGKSKVIHRYVPREVGELLVYYLWIALPFWIQLEGVVGEPVQASAYIWEPEPEKEWLMPQRKRRRTDGSSPRNVGHPQDRVDEGSPEAASPVETWNSNRVGTAIRKVSLEHIGVPMTIMGWRHSTKAIYQSMGETINS